MNRAALLLGIVTAIALPGCGKPSATAGATAGQFEINGVELGKPLGSSSLAERLKKQNPSIGPHLEKIGGAPILFSRVQLDDANNVQILYLKFDEEDYQQVKRALAEKYPMDCKTGTAKGRSGKDVEDELCIHTTATGSLALRRRDQRHDTSSVGLISAALGKPQLEGLFTADQRKHP